MKLSRLLLAYWLAGFILLPTLSYAQSGEEACPRRDGQFLGDRFTLTFVFPVNPEPEQEEELPAGDGIFVNFADPIYAEPNCGSIVGCINWVTSQMEGQSTPPTTAGEDTPSTRTRDDCDEESSADREVSVSLSFRPVFTPGDPTSVHLEPDGPADFARPESLSDAEANDLASRMASQMKLLTQWNRPLSEEQNEAVIDGAPLKMPPMLAPDVEFGSAPPGFSLPAACASLFRANGDIASLLQDRDSMAESIADLEKRIANEREKAGWLGKFWDSDYVDHLEEQLEARKRRLQQIDQEIAEKNDYISRREKVLHQEGREQELDAIRADPEKLAAEEARRRQELLDVATDAAKYKWQYIEGEQKYVRNLAAYDALIEQVEANSNHAHADSLRTEKARLEKARDSWRESVERAYQSRKQEERRLVQENTLEGIGPTTDATTLLHSEGSDPIAEIDSGVRERARAFAERQVTTDAVTFGGTATEQLTFADYTSGLAPPGVQIWELPEVVLSRYGAFAAGLGEGTLDAVRDLAILATEAGDTAAELAEFWLNEGFAAAGVDIELNFYGDENLDILARAATYLSEAEMESIRKLASQIVDAMDRKFSQMAARGEEGVKEAMSMAGYTTATIVAAEEIFLAKALKAARIAQKGKKLAKVANKCDEVAQLASRSAGSPKSPDLPNTPDVPKTRDGSTKPLAESQSPDTTRTGELKSRVDPEIGTEEAGKALDEVSKRLDDAESAAAKADTDFKKVEQKAKDSPDDFELRNELIQARKTAKRTRDRAKDLAFRKQLLSDAHTQIASEKSAIDAVKLAQANLGRVRQIGRTGDIRSWENTLADAMAKQDEVLRGSRKVDQSDLDWLSGAQTQLNEAESLTAMKTMKSRFSNQWKKMLDDTMNNPDVSTAEIHKMTTWRKQEVDGILNEVIGDVSKFDHRSHEALAFGSNNLSSDYDLSIKVEKGPGSVEVVDEFNQRFREKFGAESGTVFDTNVYTEPSYSFINESKMSKGRQLDNTPTKSNRVRQAIYRETKVRRYTSEAGWAKHREITLNDLSGNDRRAFEYILDQAEDNVSRANKAIERGMETAAGGADELALKRADQKAASQAGNRDEAARLAGELDDLELQAANKRYVELLRKVDDSMLALDDLQTPFVRSDPAALRDLSFHLETTALAEYPELSKKLHEAADLMETAKHAERVTGGESQEAMEAIQEANRILDDVSSEFAGIARDRQGEALYYAAEAYFTEGAIAHVVGEVQAGGRAITAKSLLEEAPTGRLSKGEYLDSFYENRGDMMKELGHYRDANGNLTKPTKAAAKVSKYLVRQLDAVKQAKVSDLAEYNKLVEATVAVNEVRGGTVQQIEGALESLNLTSDEFVRLAESSSDALTKAAVAQSEVLERAAEISSAISSQ